MNQSGASQKRLYNINDMTLTQVRQLLAALDLHPRKALGQNFLIDANILRIIVEQAEIRADERVLEIGPGLGMLTAALLKLSRHLVAIEKDTRLCQNLREQFPALGLIEGDALKVELPAVDKVVSNLPYNVGTAIVERLVDSEQPPRRMVVTLQREVVERMLATPRHKEYGVLTLCTQLRYHVTLAHKVSASCFYPAPNVESAIVVLDRREPRVKLEDGAPFHALVRAGFSQRRKMLHKLLTEFGDVDAAFGRLGIALTVRAEELNLEQWIALANAMRVRLQIASSLSLKHNDQL